MKEQKEHKDVDNIDDKLSDLLNSFSVIDNNMIALAMDYKFYIKEGFGDNEIYTIRDSILYRLRSTRLHARILSGLFTSLDSELTDLHLKSLKDRKDTIPLQLHFLNREKDISALFDSILFHAVSAFDYVGNLIGFIVSNKNKLKWTQLAKSCRDEKNEIGKTTMAKLIDNLDRSFVGRLYDHRSYLIHIRNEESSMSYEINLTKGIVKSKIDVTKNFIKNFSELRELSRTHDLSLAYVLFWLLEKTTDSIIDIQFGLKDYMETNRKVNIPLMFRKGPNNEILPISSGYWSRKKQ